MGTSDFVIKDAATVAEAMLPLAVQHFEASMSTEWDRFVLGNPFGTLFHLTAWKRVLEKTFGYPSFYFCSKRGQEITGISPLFLITNPVIGKCLLSIPFAVYGGLVAEDEVSAQHLVAASTQLARSLQVDYLELRMRKGGPLPGFHPNLRYATFTTQLGPNHEANLKRLPRDTRYMIRKGEKAGLTTRHGLDQMDTFYRLFAQNMRHHGTPVFPREFLQNLQQEFGIQLDVMLVYLREQAIGGVLSFVFRDAILPYYAGVGPLMGRVAGNNFMYAELMRWAVEQGLRTFDFGRSKLGTGAYAFKTGWNMQVDPLDYQVYLVRRTTPPNFSPTNPGFEFATRIWSRMPLWATLLLGPRISPWFP